MGKRPLDLQIKKERLEVILKQYGSVAIAFSGGVDSTFLLAVAHATLKWNAIAITARSPVHPAREIEAAVGFTERRGIQHLILDTKEMQSPEFLSNGKNRCYICKKSMFTEFTSFASSAGISRVAHGANADDMHNSTRPGLRAAKEVGIESPLAQAGLNKEDIRFLSKQLHLDTWNKPPLACLATRIPHGTLITADKLKQVEQAEEFILNQGLVSCRVRIHGDVARIEVSSWDIDRMLSPKVRKLIVENLRKLGFSHVALDMEGYVRGKSNRK